MLHLFQEPHGFALEKWHGFLASTILASLAAIRLYLNRNKPDAEVHESRARTGKTLAETRQIDAESAKSFSEVMLAMSDKIAQLHENQSSQQERHNKQVEFLQSQVKIRTEAEREALAKEQLARDRAHDFAGEVQRCVARIRDYEEIMRHAEPPIDFIPFDCKTYDEIMNGS